MTASSAVDKTGALLINLGTPEAPEPGPVRRYLREFLSDPRVIDINPIGRWLLLNLIILPFRPARSAAAYRKVWTPKGSPLLVHGRELTAAVQRRLPDWEVRLAMRYGEPSLRDGLTALRAAGCDRIVAMPLYPQFASSSTGSTVEALYAEVGRHWNTPFVTVVPPFYEHPDFIEALAARGRPVLDDLDPEHVLFSFHGLPVRHVTKSAPSGCCRVDDECCARISIENQNCYRAQCFATARALATALGLETPDYTVSFQSRLGRTEWIKPYTDIVIEELGKRGVKRLAVFCPAFVADCLETLEEIGIAAAESFREAGGDRLELVPAVNATDRWADGVAAILQASEPPASRRQLPVVT